MAEITPVFELMATGSGSTATKDDWFNLSSYGLSIPNGSKLWLGYMTVIAGTKSLSFQLRRNLPGESLGTEAKTELIGFSNVDAGLSAFVDLYLYGSIVTMAPTVARTVENLWLRITSGTQTVSTWDYMTYYTVY